MIDNIERPEEINNENYLLLSSDSVRQLNVFNNYSFYTGRNKDLFSLLQRLHESYTWYRVKQAGAELCQAQFKLV